MRPFELALLLLTLAGAWLLHPGASPARRRTFLALAALLLGTQLALEGPHFQIAPLYLALALVLWFGLGQGTGRLTRTTVVLLALATVAMSAILPMFRLPAPTGPDAIGTRTLHLQNGPRELVVQLWYPAAAAAPAGPLARYTRPAETKPLMRYEAQIRTHAHQDTAAAPGPFPVILLEHMWGGRRTGYTFLAEELASHGFVVVAPDHTGNAARTQLASGQVILSSGPGLLNDIDAHPAADVEAMWNRELEVWTADDEFLLNQLNQLNQDPASWLAGHLDLTRVAAVGHSFGGAESLRLLGLDPRVRAAVNLDGWSFGGLRHRTTQPVLFVYEGSSRDRTPKPGTEGKLDADDNAQVDQTLNTHGGYRVYVDRTQHLDFSDQTLVSPIQRLTYTGPLPGSRSREITRGLILGFLQQSLLHQGPGPAQFPEVHRDAGNH